MPISNTANAYPKKFCSKGGNMAEVEIKKAGCCFCMTSCGVLAHVKDGTIIKVKGNPEHMLSRGFGCERLSYVPKWLYHQDQLKHPLKRLGKRGEGKWQRIPWAQAIEEIAGKLNELKVTHGPETLAVIEGTFRGENFWARSRFLNLFGNPQNGRPPLIR